MYTQCPECSTIFEIAPADLAVAAGTVRCGECNKTFNALTTLSDTPVAFESPTRKRETARKPAAKTLFGYSPQSPATPFHARRGASAENNGLVAPAATSRIDEASPDNDAGAENDQDIGAAARAHIDTTDADDDGQDSASAHGILTADPDKRPAADASTAHDDIDTTDADDDEQDSASAHGNLRSDTNDDQAIETVVAPDPVDDASPDDHHRDPGVDNLQPASGAEIADDAAHAEEPADEADTLVALNATNETDADQAEADSEYLLEEWAEDKPDDDDRGAIQAHSPGETISGIDNFDETGPTAAHHDDEDLSAVATDELADVQVDDTDEPSDANDDAVARDDDTHDYDDEPEIVLDEFYRPAIDDSDDIDDDEWQDDAVAEPDAKPEVDSSALFSLPVPELRAAEAWVSVAVPEKLEGGEAAVDPSAQASSVPATAPPTPVHSYDWSTPAAEDGLIRSNDALDAEDARDLRDYLETSRPGRLVTGAWITGSVLLFFALLLQIVHYYSGALVIHPRIGPPLAAVYGFFGREITPSWRINDYEVVGQARLFKMGDDETTPTTTGAYRFVAIITNRADRPQPPPLVRLTLRDRWGDPTGVRNFSPPEYLTDIGMVSRLLEPGQRLRVVLNLGDPGTEVDGFDFEMCLHDRRGTLRCADEPAG